MCLLLESICWENGRMALLDHHLNRMNSSRRELLGITDAINFPLNLKPPNNPQSKWKLRITYNQSINSIQWIPYIKSNPTKVLVLDPGPISYSFKFADRTVFENIKKEHPDFDDFIFLQNNYLTDGSYSNILLKSGEKWYTPATPLLEGVRKKHLINQGLIRERQLTKEDLIHADEIRLINAMLPFEDAIILWVENLFFLNNKS